MLLTYKLCVLPLLLVFVLTFDVNGFFQYCDVNQTLFVPEGSSATLRAEGNFSPFTSFMKYNDTRYNVFTASFSCCDYTTIADDVHIGDPWIRNRTKIIGHPTGLVIIIDRVEKADNGTYVLYLPEKVCFVLIVFSVHRQPAGPIEEHSPAYFYAYPKASQIRRPLINATMVWLIDGKNITQSPQFVLQDGMIWISSISRILHGRNITYRAMQDNGNATDANFTVDVTYGPDAPLSFTPNKAHYFLSNGQTMLDVYCTIDCNPPCTVLWDKNGKDKNLSLGKVSGATTGEYTCIATRPGVDIVLTRSLTVQVEDNTGFTVAIAMLASVQAITAIVLGLCGLYIYTRNNTLPCQTCLKDSRTQNASAKTTQTGFTTSAIETERDNYEELDPASRHRLSIHQYECVAYAGKSSEKGVE